MVPKRSLYTFAIIIAISSQSSGKGGSYHVEDRYNPQHIDDLPFDIRNSILHRCGMPKALHSFARYSDGSKRIALHFEYFVCDGDGSYCTANDCLHQLWILHRGHYRLERSYYAPRGD